MTSGMKHFSLYWNVLVSDTEEGGGSKDDFYFMTVLLPSSLKTVRECITLSQNQPSYITCTRHSELSFSA